MAGFGGAVGELRFRRIPSKEKKMADVYCVGEMVIDFTPGTEKNSYIRNPGGAPANVAIALSRLGKSAAFCGKVGDDDFGCFLQETLEENGVGVACTKRTKEAVTTLVFVSLDKNGNRSFTFARKPGADMLLSPEDIRRQDIQTCKIVHAGSCSLSAGTARAATMFALQSGRALGKRVSFDVNYRALLWTSPEECAEQVRRVLPFVDFLKISDEEVFLLGGEEALAGIMRTFGISLIVLTRGRHPVKAIWQGGVLEQPVPDAEVLDTTGAGDAFWGAALAALLDAGITETKQLTEADLRSALSRGAAAGTFCVQRYGAIPALPYLAELEIAMRKTEHRSIGTNAPLRF